MGEVVALEAVRYAKGGKVFSEAFAYLDRGGLVARINWPEKTRFLMIIHRGDNFYPNPIKSDDRIIGDRQLDGSFIEWIPTSQDLLARDWELIDGIIP